MSAARKTAPAEVIASPFGRYPGGKSSLAPQLLPLFPPPSTVTGVYREPFAGMGAMAYAYAVPAGLRVRGPGWPARTRSRLACAYAVPAGLRIALSDTEAGLVASYLAVRDHVNELVERLRAMPFGKEHYYAARDRLNAPIATPMFTPPIGLVEHAALFLYLRKTCFNGLMRTSGDGIYNVMPQCALVVGRVIVPHALRLMSVRYALT